MSSGGTYTWEDIKHPYPLREPSRFQRYEDMVREATQELRKLCKLPFYWIRLSSVWAGLKRASPRAGKSLEKAIVGVHARLSCAGL